MSPTHAEKWSIIGKRKILLWKSSWRKTNIVWNQIYSSRGEKLIFCVKWIICQQCIFLLEQDEIILTDKSRLFSLGAKGFHLPQMDLSVRASAPKDHHFTAKTSNSRKLLQSLFHSTILQFTSHASCLQTWNFYSILVPPSPWIIDFSATLIFQPAYLHL